ncbi:MAG: RNA polymerase sigma-70 factor [Bacteroidales bacterium]
MGEYGLFSDEKLMQEIKANNMFAFDILYKKYSKRLYFFGYSILKSQEETENLIQDVFLNLWEKRNDVERDASVKYYLFSIAYNSAITRIRQKTKESEFISYIKSLPEIIEEPTNLKIEFNELSNKLEGIIQELPQRQKQVYILHRVKGFKYSEIAERLKISPNTIENHMSRALKTIRAKLEFYDLLSALFFLIFV